MEKLQIEPKAVHRTAWHAGNEVLRILYPVIRGETPAAQHTAQLVAALVTYAEGTVADIAAAALSAAAREGRLLDFTRHTYRITAQAAARGAQTAVTLTACHTAGDSVLHTYTLTMYWSENETLQRRTAPRMRAEKCAAIKL